MPARPSRTAPPVARWAAFVVAALSAGCAASPSTVGPEPSATAAATPVPVAPARTPLRSGPQPGGEILFEFRPVNLNGEHAGEPFCLVCENGRNPVVMILARRFPDGLADLVVRLEAAVEAHRGQSLGAFVVFLSDDAPLVATLTGFAASHKLRHVVFATEDPAVLKDYELADDAEVTAVLYREFAVKANHAFRAGELTPAAAEAVARDIAKIVPAR